MCDEPSVDSLLTSAGCILESNHRPEFPPKSVEDPQHCNFFAENFQRTYCGVEWDMHVLVKNMIKPTDTVLEVGGRYGTTTCALAVQQNNSGALIVVEPDSKVWAIHEVGKFKTLSANILPEYYKL